MPIHLLKGRLICKRSPAFLAPHQWVVAAALLGFLWRSLDA